MKVDSLTSGIYKHIYDQPVIQITGHKETVILDISGYPGHTDVTIANGILTDDEKGLSPEEAELKNYIHSVSFFDPKTNFQRAKVIRSDLPTTKQLLLQENPRSNNVHISLINLGLALSLQCAPEAPVSRIVQLDVENDFGRLLPKRGTIRTIDIPYAMLQELGFDFKKITKGSTLSEEVFNLILDYRDERYLMHKRYLRLYDSSLRTSLGN